MFRARTVERGLVAQVLRLIFRSLLRRSWHLPRGLTISLAGCRGFTGPVPPPLSMSAAGRPACLAGNYITSCRRMQCRQMFAVQTKRIFFARSPLPRRATREDRAQERLANGRGHRGARSAGRPAPLELGQVGRRRSPRLTSGSKCSIISPTETGILLVDETGFLKKGEKSVGVARQNTGLNRKYMSKSWPLAYL